MPANLLSSPSLLSGTVVALLLIWLVGSALMTLLVGRKQSEAVDMPIEKPGGPMRALSQETPVWPGDQESAGMTEQPLLAVEEIEAARGMTPPLGFTRGQRAGEHADPEMVFFAASADS